MTTYTKTTLTAWAITIIIALVLLCIFGFTVKFGISLAISFAVISVVQFLAGVIVGVDSVDEHDEYETP